MICAYFKTFACNKVSNSRSAKHDEHLNPMTIIGCHFLGQPHKMGPHWSADDENFTAAPKLLALATEVFSKQTSKKMVVLAVYDHLW